MHFFRNQKICKPQKLISDIMYGIYNKTLLTIFIRIQLKKCIFIRDTFSWKNSWKKCTDLFFHTSFINSLELLSKICMKVHVIKFCSTYLLFFLELQFIFCFLNHKFIQVILLKYLCLYMN